MKITTCKTSKAGKHWTLGKYFKLKIPFYINVKYFPSVQCLFTSYALQSTAYAIFNSVSPSII